jgi:hypothetical protein
MTDEIERGHANQATASPSMMQERERRRANASTISGKQWVRSFTETAVEPHPLAVFAGNDAKSRRA